MATDESSRQTMRVIDLLKHLVDLPMDTLREACRMNPDAPVYSEGCDCWGDVVWIQASPDGSVTLYREVPQPAEPKPPQNWFTRDGRKVQAGHPEAFIEVNEAWAQYFATGTWPPAAKAGG